MTNSPEFSDEVVSLSLVELALVDAMRGLSSRSQFVRAAIVALATADPKARTLVGDILALEAKPVHAGRITRSPTRR